MTAEDQRHTVADFRKAVDNIADAFDRVTCDEIADDVADVVVATTCLTLDLIAVQILEACIKLRQGLSR